MGLASLAWEPELLDAVGVPAAMLPAIRSSSEVYGHGVGDLAGVPIAGDLGDQQAALFGQTCFEPGQLKCTYGTGCFMLMHTGEQPGRLASRADHDGRRAARRRPATYALEGSVAVAGALIGWLRDNLGIIGDASEVEALARSVPDSGDVVFVPAFSGLFAPHWRSDARGVIAGLTRLRDARRTSPAPRSRRPPTRSTTSAVAMVADLGADLPGELRVDGGMIGNELLMQFQADILGAAGRGAADRRDDRARRGLRGRPGGRVLERPRRAAGDGPSRAVAGSRAMDEATRAAGIARWHKGVERTLGWVEPGA